MVLSKLSRKKPPLLFTLGTAVLLIGGGLIAYWTLSRRGPGSQAIPAGSQVIPESALMAATLPTANNPWRQLRQFGTAETQARFDQWLIQGQQRLWGQHPPDFSRDLPTWVGPEITVALLPAAAAAAPPEAELPPFQQAQPLVVVPIADAVAAQAWLAERPDLADDTASRDYRGVTITPIPRPQGSPLFAAVLTPDWVVLSPHEVALEQAIDTTQGGRSLAQRPGYGSAFQQVAAAPAFGRLYLNMAAAAQQIALNAQPPLPPSQWQALQAPRGLAAVLYLESQGLRMQGLSWLPPNSDQTYASQNGPDQLPRQLPAETLMMVSGGNLEQFWQDLSQGLQLGALLPLNPENLSAGLQASTGLRLEEDLLPWMQGEFALAVLESAAEPAAPGDAPDSADDTVPLPSTNLVALVQVSDREAAEQAFERLDQVMVNRYRFQVDSLELSGRPVTRWTTPYQSLQLSHGWLADSTAFFTVGAGVAATLLPAPEASLTATEAFERAFRQSPRVNNGHFFVDFERLRQSTDSLWLPDLPADSLIGSGAIQSIGVTATVDSPRHIRYDLYVGLKRGPRPRPLPTPAPSPQSDDDGTASTPESSQTR
ncbi:DUF3352 domain-containing protein [Halomicronema hongdechloris]|nr:DUF3352 domain-containing protein [Halomicronema hongdechloris]